MTIVVPGGGGGSGTGTVAVNVTQHGVTPFGPDCTAALTSLIATQIVASQVAGTNYVELYFPPGQYNFTGAPTQGGSTHGNAQVPLPVIPNTVEKMVLVLRSGYGGDALPIFGQTVGQKTPCSFYTTHVGSNDGTFGECSVVGGPTPAQGYGISGLFSNMLIVIDGISVVNGQTPGNTVNPSMCGFDFWGVSEMAIGTAGAFCDAPTNTVALTPPTNSWVFGLRPPAPSNNDLCNIYSWSCEGYYFGLLLTEHVVGTSVRVVYCQVGISGLSPDESYPHSSTILYASVESCVFGVTWQTYMQFTILMLDIEHQLGSPFAPGFDISDGGTGNARGYIGFVVSGGGEGEGTEPLVNGCENAKIVNLGRRPAVINAAAGAPAVPTTGGLIRNPFWRDAFISVSGGTLTNYILSLGDFTDTIPITSPCIIPVPSGASIALTYTGTPVWTWTLV